MKKILFILFLSLFSISTYAQIDTEFWFAFPDITNGDYGADNSIKLCLISFDNACTVHISQPADVQGFDYRLDTTVYLPPNSVKTLDLKDYKSQLETNADISYPYGLPLGILITSDNNISAYYANTSNDSEIYTLKGKNALGIDFLVPMQYEYKSGAYAEAFNSIEILATEDNTNITIDLLQWTTSPLQTNQKQTITIQLNRGWCYSFAAKGKTGAEHLHNTRIKSDKPIAVNSTDDSVEPGDLIGDQLIPVKVDESRYLAGKEYIAVRNFGLVEKVYVFPTEKNTKIWIDGVLQPTLVNLGDRMMIDLSQQTYDATYIISDKPITVFQITSKRNAKELGGAIIPAIVCTGSTETVYKSAFDGEITLDLITKTSYVGSFTLNGQTGFISVSDFSVVQANPEYSFARITLSSSSPILANNGGIIRIKNSAGVFHAGALDYPIGNNSCSYGYFSDFRELELNLIADKGAYYSGDSLILNMQNVESLTNIVWTKPDGNEVHENPLIIKNLTESDAGIYSVIADSKDGCITPEPGYIVIDVFKALKDEQIICRGDSVELFSRGIAPYTWSPEKDMPNLSAVMVSPMDTVIYEVENHQQGQSVIINGDFQLGNKNFESDLMYGGTTSSAVSNPGYYSVWKIAREVNSALSRAFDHTTGSSSDGLMLIANLDGNAGKKIWTKTFDVKPNTRYKFSGWFITPTTSGSQLSLDFAINEQKQGKTIIPPFTKTISNPSLWKNDSCFWDSGNRTTVTISIVTNQSSAASVCVDDIKFHPYLPVTDTMQVNVVEAALPKITGDSIVCQGRAVLDAGGFENGNDFNSYSWYTIDDKEEIANTRTLAVSESGIYIVEVNNSICNRLDTFRVAAGEKLEISIDSIIAICPGEPYFTLNYNSASGQPSVYDVIYDSAAIAAGFSNITNEVITTDDILEIKIPTKPLSGTYNALLRITGNSFCAPIADQNLAITVKIDPGSFIAQKWNDVLALYNKENNGGYDFIAYQWYKNGIALEKETGSYLYLGVGNVFDIDDRYAVQLTLSDGTTLMTCDFTPEERENFLTFPNVVAPMQMIKLQGLVDVGNVRFWDIRGFLHSNQTIDKGSMEVQAPSKKGWYVMEVNTEEIQSKHKISVQ